MDMCTDLLVEKETIEVKLEACEKSSSEPWYGKLTMF